MSFPVARLRSFIFPAVSDRWVAILRFGLGMQIICFCISLRTDWRLLYSSQAHSLVSRELSEAFLSQETSLTPRLGWLVAGGGYFHLSEATVLNIVWLLLALSGLGLLAGYFSRINAILAWFLYLSVTKSAALTTYGLDNATIIGLFYLMIAPLPDSFSFDFAYRDLAAPNRTRLGFHLRLLQLHLCLIYFFSGLTKAIGPDWWNGASLWRSLTREPFDMLPLQVVAPMAPLLPFLGIGVWLLEITYPILIWPRRTRLYWLAGTLALHVGIALTMGLYLFAMIMMVLNLAAFGSTVSNPFRPRQSARPLNPLDA